MKNLVASSFSEYGKSCPTLPRVYGLSPGLDPVRLGWLGRAQRQGFRFRDVVTGLSLKEKHDIRTDHSG